MKLCDNLLNWSSNPISTALNLTADKYNLIDLELTVEASWVTNSKLGEWKLGIPEAFADIFVVV